MKKIKNLVVASVAVGGLLLTSCTVVHTATVTNNAVGSKKSKTVTHPFKMAQGVNYSETMKKGGISKVGLSEYKMIYVLGFPIEKFEVTGN